MKEVGEIPITLPHVERQVGRESETVNMLERKPRLRDKLFVQTPDRDFITRSFSHAVFTGSVPCNSWCAGVPCQGSNTTGTRLAAAVTTISYPRVLAWWGVIIQCWRLTFKSSSVKSLGNYSGGYVSGKPVCLQQKDSFSSSLSEGWKGSWGWVGQKQFAISLFILYLFVM